jgi:hypothetical protein
MECCQNANSGSMEHRNRKRSMEGYLLGVLPGVRQDQPRFRTGRILNGKVRLFERGAATPSGLNMRMNVPNRGNPSCGQRSISNCSPGSSQSSESTVRPGSVLYLPETVQFGQTLLDDRSMTGYHLLSRGSPAPGRDPRRRSCVTYEKRYPQPDNPSFSGSMLRIVTGLVSEILLTEGYRYTIPTGWRLSPTRTYFPLRDLREIPVPDPKSPRHPYAPAGQQ